MLAPEITFASSVITTECRMFESVKAVVERIARPNTKRGRQNLWKHWSGQESLPTNLLYQIEIRSTMFRVTRLCLRS
jgi:hypothetical protein